MAQLTPSPTTSKRNAPSTSLQGDTSSTRRTGRVARSSLFTSIVLPPGRPHSASAGNLSARDSPIQVVQIPVKPRAAQRAHSWLRDRAAQELNPDVGRLGAQ